MTKWLFFTFVAIFIQGLFAMFEMSCVSFNRIRLQYFVSLGKKRAIWLYEILQNPSRLFGTTLLGVNASLQIGSECSREFYESIHLDPSLAPISQVFIVVLLAELIPMFVARKHPERVALFLAPLMVIFANLFRPFTWLFDKVSQGISQLIHKTDETHFSFSREEVMMALQREERGPYDLTQITDSIFKLKNMTASSLMTSLKDVPIFSSIATVGDVKRHLKENYQPILPIYHRQMYNIVSIVLSRDLIGASNEDKILGKGKSPWFVTLDTSILQLIHQFRRNNQSVAIMLDSSGEAKGILTLDKIIDFIFGPEKAIQREEELGHFISRTLKGSLLISEFNRQFGTILDANPTLKLNEFLLSKLDHPPSLGETIFVGPYRFVILELSLRGIRKVAFHAKVDVVSPKSS
jgi:putative hemolysin